VPFVVNDANNDFQALAKYVGCVAPWYIESGGVYYDTKEADLESESSGSEGYYYSPSGYNGFPCYSHNSLADLIEGGSYNWTYYIQDSSYDNSIWTAPNSLTEDCTLAPSDEPEGGVCSTTQWTNHVTDTMGQVLADIHNCALQQVSWVIPDGTWSDHPGTEFSDGGPSWVAAIVNAIGGTNEYACSEDSHRYWGDGEGGGKEPTVVLVTWDDWGGWYDHVAPWDPNGVNGGYGNKEGSYDGDDGNYYIYGARVPLLVVSAYNNHCAYPMTCNDDFTGYISGTLGEGGETQPYIHDFGSLLGFVEWNFNLSPYNSPSSGCGIAGPTLGTGGCNYEFADWFAPDGVYECSKTTDPSNCGETTAYPLEDFFNLSASPTSFTGITGAKYDPSCFIAPASSGCFGVDFAPQDPDNDAIDE
jgi:hypothetical protein